jgi:hypothetical protein
MIVTECTLAVVVWLKTDRQNLAFAVRGVRFQPGGLHRTVAGSGIVHDEVVEEIGRIGHGVRPGARVELPATAPVRWTDSCSHHDHD